MNNVFNKDNKKWIRPWNLQKFDDLYNRDERFLSIIMKGLISWLNRNIVMYNESINHFIFNTGSSYLYIESNGYEYNLSETTGEDAMYMQLPRCIIELSNIHIPQEELSSPFSRGNYERRDGNLIRGYNAEIRRLPLEINVKLQYYLGTFNESLVLMQELIDKLVFQQYFNVTYLGNIIQCSIEFPPDSETQINKIDMTSPDPNQRIIELSLIINTNYPIINERSEIPTDKVIEHVGYNVDLYMHDKNSDEISKGNIINEDDGFKEFEDNLVKEKEDIIFENIDDENIDELINKYDINNDGIIDENELEDLLEKTKYEFYDEDLDYAEECHYRIDYKDIYYAIKLINKQSNISAYYDKFTKKIYVTHNDTGNIAEIDMIKYKIIK